MRKLPKVSTQDELSIVHNEGKKAFKENRRRGYNPYTTTNQGLAMEWWHGWDTAQEESRGNNAAPRSRDEP